MASWIVHLRICDGLIDSLEGINAPLFAVGNIGPDCGVKTDTGFSPPATTTHFSYTEQKSDIRREEYYDTFVKHSSPEDLPFYLGYYVHLLTDMMWVEDIYYPDRAKYAAQFEENPKFYKEFKRDWYDLDKLFIQKHPDFRAYRMLCTKRVDKPYHEYYTADLINARAEHIAHFYEPTDENLNREYPYLTEDRMDAFVVRTIDRIKQILREKKHIK